MYYVADTGKLVADGVIDDHQAHEIQSRARAAMVALSVNTLLIGGIVAATLGLVFYLGTPLSVAICGGLFLGGGLAILRYADALYRMFGNASAVIGAGMLIAGGGIEIADRLRDIAGPWLLLLGLGISALFIWRFLSGLTQLRFAYGAALTMGIAMHMVGVYTTAQLFDLSGWPMPFINLYAAAVLVGLGALLDIRFITALAIVPFAQILDTGTFYFHAAYVFYSPESTLSILLMALLMLACFWAIRRGGDVLRKQAGILLIMAFIVANLCALVGSLWGDVVGSHIWGPQASRTAFDGDWDAYWDAIDAFEASAITISDNLYAILWAIVLAGLIIFAALRNQRGLFNAGMTFAGIHAYTQMFESFHDQPLAYVVGGLAAIPLAFGLWRLNNTWFKPVQVGTGT
ncbi:hypothetical protein [Yoonia sp.]|uniref:hypothetical protein n=1 Tax=Yoonia sp. TaxID=2212373 RepID=UPI002FD8ABA6